MTSAMGDKANPHTVELEAHGQDIPKLREFLKDIELSSELTRFRIEIESENPIFKTPTEIAESVEQESGETPEKEPETEPEQVEVESPDENGSKDHPTDKLKFQKHEKGETQVLSHTDKDFEGITKFNTETNRWKLCSFLYRQNEPLKLGHIHKFLEDTPYEVNYKTLSATLSNLKNSDIVENTNPGKGPAKYRLTEEGEKRVAKTQDEADSYILTMADKVAGMHPTNSFDPPDLEA